MKRLPDPSENLFRLSAEGDRIKWVVHKRFDFVMFGIMRVQALPFMWTLAFAHSIFNTDTTNNHMTYLFMIQRYQKMGKGDRLTGVNELIVSNAF